EFTLRLRKVVRIGPESPPQVGDAEEGVYALEEAADGPRVCPPRREEHAIRVLVQRNDVENRGELGVLELVDERYGEVGGRSRQVQTDHPHGLHRGRAPGGARVQLRERHEALQTLGDLR